MERSIYFRRMVDVIKAAAADAASAAETVDHAGLAGTIREIALLQCINPFLTPSYRCGTGKVLDSAGGLSKQIDLVVYGNRQVAPLMLNIGPTIFPSELCEYVFEVKSTLTAAEIRSAIDVARSVQALSRYPGGADHPGKGWRTVLFAFASDIVGHELERYLRYDTSAVPAFTIIIVLGKGYWFFVEGEGWFGIEATSLPDPWEIYPLFATGMLNTLAEVEMSFFPFNPGAYILKGENIVAGRFAAPSSPPNA